MIHLSAIIYLGHGIERKVQLWCVRMQLEGCYTCTPTILNENQQLDSWTAGPYSEIKTFWRHSVSGSMLRLGSAVLRFTSGFFWMVELQLSLVNSHFLIILDHD